MLRYRQGRKIHKTRNLCSSSAYCSCLFTIKWLSSAAFRHVDLEVTEEPLNQLLCHAFRAPAQVLVLPWPTLVSVKRAHALVLVYRTISVTFVRLNRVHVLACLVLGLNLFQAV